ncbi:hypothetical protein CDD83_4505 [Cordyceps sp. RAO-2017]|nr:hypothetical protein CDD83_4505 [Cordyceps sp. RAO-2017]
MRTAGYPREGYLAVFRDTIRKAKQTRLLETRTLSQWTGARDVVRKWEAMTTWTEKTLLDYLLPAPTILCVACLVFLRRVVNQSGRVSVLMAEHKQVLRLRTAMDHHHKLNDDKMNHLAFLSQNSEFFDRLVKPGILGGPQQADRLTTFTRENRLRLQLVFDGRLRTGQAAMRDGAEASHVNPATEPGKEDAKPDQGNEHPED